MWSLVLLVLQVYALRLMTALTDYRYDLQRAVTQDSRVTCAFDLIRSELADTTHIIVFGHASWLAAFVEATPVPFSVLQMEEKHIPIYNLQLDVVFLVSDDVGNRSFVDHALSLVRRRHVRYLPRVVVWWRDGLTQAAVDSAWDLEIVRLVIISGFSKTLNIFAYREKCIDGSLVARPVLMRGCSARNLFPDVLHRNMEGCPLRVGFDELPPLLMVEKIRGSKYKFQGVLGHLPLILSERFNSSLDAQPPSDCHSAGKVFENGTADGLVGDVLSKRYDLGVHEFTRIRDREAVADFSPSQRAKCITFIVPSGLGPKRNPWNVLLLAFQPTVWTLTVLAFLMFVAVLSVAWWRMREHPVLDSAFYMLSIGLSNSPPFTADVATFSARILVAHWLILSIVLTTGFQAVRHSITAAPWKARDIEDLNQLQKAGLKVKGHPTSLSVLTDIANKSDGDPILLELMKRAEPIFGPEEEAKRMAIESNVALVFDPEVIIHFVAHLEKAGTRRLVHTIPVCPISAYTAVFMLRRGSPWTGAVSYVVSRAFECGLTQHWENMYQERRQDTNQGWSQLSFAKLSAVFQFLLLGQAFGALVLLVEAFVYRRRQK